MQRATASYYGMIEKTDQHFGKVIQALENAGENIDDWIIIYTSDHGEMLGEHGLWEKLQFFEGSVRVPMFIRYPKRFKSKMVNKNVSLIDLFPTLCDLCGIDIPSNIDGRSLVPLLEGDNSFDWDNKVFSTYRDIFMCKIDNLKYHYYRKFDNEVLWDLETDPKESINFINDIKYNEIVKEFRKEKEIWLQTIKNKEQI